MKILYHHRIASKDGQYVHVEEINYSLKKQGHQIHMVAPAVAEASEFGSDGGWVDTLKQKLPGALYEILEFSYSFWALWKLLRTIKQHRPDVIYERFNLFFPAGIWAAKITGLPLLLEVNAPLYQERKKHNGISLNKLAQWSQRYCWKNADMCLPVTDVLADYLRQEGVAEERIKVIPNGINVDTFYGPSPAINTDLSLEDNIVIGFVGFCRDWHGLDRVLQVMSEQKDSRLFFLVIGDGPAVEGLKQTAHKLGLDHQFSVTGLVSREDMPAWLDYIDIALQPDVVPYASPLKMLEYLAKGKAIVAPDTPNIRELLQDKQNALLFDPSVESDFSQCLSQLCQNDELRVKLGRAAAATIDQDGLTWDNNAKTIVSIANGLLKQNTS